jgi:hypothetical protein
VDGEHDSTPQVAAGKFDEQGEEADKNEAPLARKCQGPSINVAIAYI